VTKRRGVFTLSPNLRELLLIGGAYVVSPASAPDLAGDVLEPVSLPAGG
jgi:hypothetical protein